MEIFKVIGIAISAVVISIILKRDRPEISLLVGVSAGILILLGVLSSMTGVIEVFDDLIYKTGVNEDLFAGVLKIIGIGYLTEYTSAICNDYGQGSLAEKVQLSGKISIFLMSVPIIKELVSVISSLV